MTITTQLDTGDRQILTLHQLADPDRAFEEVCRLNPEARIEQTSEGEIVIMPPAGGESGFQSGEVFWQLNNWAKRDGTGRAFDSSTGFRLPNGAKRSPDACWVRNEKIRAITRESRKTLLPFGPDFAIEVMSPSDRREDQVRKCEEYVTNGTAEAWLIEPESKTVTIYIAGEQECKRFSGPESLASHLLPSFTLDLNPVWQGLDI
jgi:Uma2 family endonuclease